MSTGIFPKFFIKAVQDHPASEEEGRPIFKDVEYVEIRIAGDKSTVVVRKASDEDKARWQPVYDAFKAGLDQPIEGTPVDQWPALSVSKVAELKALNIHTVEALCDLPDTGLTKLGMGARELQKKAQAFMDAAKGGALEEKQAAYIARLEQKIELLEGQIKDLGAKPRQRKRRTKAEIEAEKAA